LFYGGINVKQKKSILFLGLIFVIMLSFPSMALAKADDYGYNAEARMFIGTLDNWEAFLRSEPPTSFNWNETDVTFIERHWDKYFDPMLQGNPPSRAGAWAKAELWKHLSGDQLGWTWHQSMTVVYSPDASIPNAIALSESDMGYDGFYCVQLEEWLTGPKGERIESQNISVKNKLIQGTLHEFGRVAKTK
jgi:hypothetical protein